MKTLYFFLITVLLFAGCSKDEDLDDFERFEDFAQFTLEEDRISLDESISLSKRGYSLKGFSTLSNQETGLEIAKVLVGRGVNKDGSGKWELDFAIMKSFLPEELGIDPLEFEPPLELSSDQLYQVFSEPGSVRSGFPVNLYMQSKIGIYMSFNLEGEYYTAVPKVYVGNEERYSVFSFKKAASSAPDQLKVEMQFDVYMQGPRENIIHLKNGKFIASYKWGE